MELRQYQREAVDAIFQYFYDGNKGNPLVIAPTASGKSLLIGAFIKETLELWKDQRILMLCHRKELLEQNFNKLIGFWPSAPVGIYSAGLKQKNLRRQITIAGIQSIFRKAKALGWVDLILIDECDLCPPSGEGTYRTLIKELMLLNPNLKVVGFTATPFRLKTGSLIDDDGFFTDIAFDIDIPRLLNEGWLSNIISKGSLIQADLSQVGTRGGEYIADQAEKAMNNSDLTNGAIDDIEKYASDRKSWIVFCTGVSHARAVAAALNARGHDAHVIVGDTPPDQRKRILATFKAGKIKTLVGVDVLTTGFDAPCTDLIVLLRPTRSTRLFIQMCGRGMRLSPETFKENCLILDFAGNIERHGPIDAIKIKRKNSTEKEKGEGVETAPQKFCEKCRTSNPIAATVCINPECNEPFPIPDKHTKVATTKELLTANMPAEWLAVEYVSYSEHRKTGSPNSLKVAYGIYGEEDDFKVRTVYEWVCLEHQGFAHSKAMQWWTSHLNMNAWKSKRIPSTVENALALTKELKRVKKIKVKKDGKFDRILEYEYFSPEEMLEYEESASCAYDDSDEIPF